MLAGKEFIGFMLGDPSKTPEAIYSEFEDLYYRIMKREFLYEKSKKNENPIASLFKGIGMDIPDFIKDEKIVSSSNYPIKDEEDRGKTIEELEKEETEEELEYIRNSASEILFNEIINGAVHEIALLNDVEKCCKHIAVISDIASISKALYHFALRACNISISVINDTINDEIKRSIKELEDKITFAMCANNIYTDNEEKDKCRRYFNCRSEFVSSDNEDLAKLKKLKELYIKANPLNLASDEFFDLLFYAFPEYEPIINKDKVLSLDSRWQEYAVKEVSNFINKYGPDFKYKFKAITGSDDLYTAIHMAFSLMTGLITVYISRIINID